MQGKARQGKLSSVPAKTMDDVFLNQPESRAHPEHIPNRRVSLFSRPDAENVNDIYIKGRTG